MMAFIIIVSLCALVWFGLVRGAKKSTKGCCSAVCCLIFLTRALHGCICMYGCVCMRVGHVDAIKRIKGSLSDYVYCRKPLHSSLLLCCALCNVTVIRLMMANKEEEHFLTQREQSGRFRNLSYSVSYCDGQQQGRLLLWSCEVVTGPVF